MSETLTFSLYRFYPTNHGRGGGGGWKYWKGGRGNRATFVPSYAQLRLEFCVGRLGDFPPFLSQFERESSKPSYAFGEWVGADGMHGTR